MKRNTQLNLSEEAKIFAKENKKIFIEKFANIREFPPSENPFSFFMAGSPGAGKTEFSKRLIEIMTPTPIVRIDADEIRELIPQYNGGNSDIVQGASSISVDNLNYFALKHKQNSIMDGTFANYTIARRNITHCLAKKRRISIFYIYQDPTVAWDFTKKREKLEGRRVPKETFIDALFKSKENIVLVKEEFGNQIKVNLVIKNKDNTLKEILYDVESTLDTHIKIPYTKQSLNIILC